MLMCHARGDLVQKVYCVHVCRSMLRIEAMGVDAAYRTCDTRVYLSLREILVYIRDILGSTYVLIPFGRIVDRSLADFGASFGVLGSS